MTYMQTTMIRAYEDDGEWVLDVRAVPFNVRDFYGTIWDRDTDFHEEYYPGGVAAVYYHGMDDDQNPVASPEYIGIARFSEKRDDGAWFKVVLDKTKEYARIVWEAAKKGMAAASVGGIEHLVRINEETGHVDEWPIGELTVFDTYNNKRPAIPYAIAVPSMRAGEPASLIDANLNWLREGIVPGGAVVRTSIPIYSKRGARTMDVEKLKEIISTLVAQFAEALLGQISQLAGGDGEPAPAPEVATEMRAEAMKAIVDKVVAAVQQDSGYRVATAETIADLINTVLEARREEFFTAGAMAARTRYEGKIRAEKEASDRAIAAARAAAPPISAIDQVGGVQVDVSNGGNLGTGTRVSGVDDLRYAHLSFEDMAIGFQLFRAQLPHNLRVAPKDIVSESYLRAMSAKAVELGKQSRKRVEDTHYMRVQSIRANEIDAVGNTGYGPEWIGQMWSTMLWEKARSDVKLYETMLAKGMWEQEVPEGAGTVNVQTEGSDPTVYSFPATADLDATNRPTVSIKTTPFGTGTVALAPGRLGVASAYDKGLQEDSAIPVLPQINRQLMSKSTESIEQAMLNGDTVITASTNINLIDGTPGTGILRPYYLNNNGLLKYPLVTNTALARDAGGQFSLEDFRLTLKLLANQFREKRANLLYFMDSDTHLAALTFPEFQTVDVRGTKATIESGYVQDIYKIDVLVTGFMALANSAGKIPAAGGTLGRLGLAYCPYWAFGWKRNILIETAYDALAQTEVVVATMRLDFKPRGADASAVSYNVGVS